MQYKTVAGPTALIVKGKQSEQKAVQAYADILQREAAGGWRLVAMQKTPVVQKAGCLSALFGGHNSEFYFNMLLYCRGEKSEEEIVRARREARLNADPVAAEISSSATKMSPTPDIFPQSWREEDRLNTGQGNSAEHREEKPNSKLKPLLIGLFSLLVLGVGIGVLNNALQNKKNQSNAETIAYQNAASIDTPLPTISENAPAKNQGDAIEDQEDSAALLPENGYEAQPSASAYETNRAAETAAPSFSLEAMVLEGDQRYYKEEELRNLSQYELSILRNGMFALSGKRFSKNRQVIDFFSACSWYAPRYDSDAETREHMNEYQLDNVNAIIAMEKEKGYR